MCYYHNSYPHEPSFMLPLMQCCASWARQVQATTQKRWQNKATNYRICHYGFHFVRRYPPIPNAGTLWGIDLASNWTSYSRREEQRRTIQFPAYLWPPRWDVRRMRTRLDSELAFSVRSNSCCKSIKSSEALSWLRTTSIFVSACHECISRYLMKAEEMHQMRITSGELLV